MGLYCLLSVGVSADTTDLNVTSFCRDLRSRIYRVILKIASLSISERPAEPRASSVVAAGKCRGRLIVPIAIKGEVPRQIAEELDVVGRIGIYTDATRL
jgi:hypothetical protein